MTVAADAASQRRSNAEVPRPPRDRPAGAPRSVRPQRLRGRRLRGGSCLADASRRITTYCTLLSECGGGDLEDRGPALFGSGLLAVVAAVDDLQSQVIKGSLKPANSVTHSTDPMIGCVAEQAGAAQPSRSKAQGWGRARAACRGGAGTATRPSLDGPAASRCPRR